MRITSTLILIFFSLTFSAQNVEKHLQKPAFLNNHHKTDKNRKTANIANYKQFKPHRKNIALKQSLQALKRLDSIVLLNWNSNTNQFESDCKLEFTYEFINNNTVENEIYYEWDDNSNKCVKVDKVEWIMDSYGNLISQILYDWDVNSQQWITGNYRYKYELVYNDNNELIEEIQTEWAVNMNQWINYNKVEYSYDANGNLVLIIFISWDINTNQWIKNNKLEFTYDGFGNVISRFGYSWDISLNQWELTPTSKEEYYYDSNQHLISYISFDWNSNNNQFIPFYKYEINNDEHGNGQTTNSYYYNGINSDWDNSSKIELTYDLNYNYEELLIPISWFIDFDFNIENMLSTYSDYYYDSQSQTWIPEDQSSYYYSDFDSSLGVEDQQFAKSISCYPNPIINILTIDSEMPLTKVEIYSILGKKLKQVNSDFKSIPTGDISNGVFTVIIYSENSLTTKKLIKK